ncbi:hypothetical protein F7725_007385 [Dissostichus mawsoni]|uniref:Uncharacterized protein n=1 Tax=Dissostichus mawsoni TaxID=36200 RepID=A0A7J5XXK9_DISMA|nr:hypothetical protein F7725_007385 [Dissostichus mawsoni]
MERPGAAKLEREGEEHTAMIQEYEENSVSYLQITSAWAKTCVYPSRDRTEGQRAGSGSTLVPGRDTSTPPTGAGHTAGKVSQSLDFRLETF